MLYGYLGVEQTRGLLSWSFAAQKIYKAARDAGYHYDTKAPQLMFSDLFCRHNAVCCLFFCDSLANVRLYPDRFAGIDIPCRSLSLIHI